MRYVLRPLGATAALHDRRCIACSNCVLACPFGVPRMMTEFDLMMKCDMCYDRTSTGRKPMCATGCSSGALSCGSRQEIDRQRPRYDAAPETPLFWATGTWWIPILLALGIWRHIRKRVPLTHEHGYWAAVFPLGMYTVFTQQLVSGFGLPFLTPIAAVFVWVALAAWAATFAGLVWSLIRIGRRHRFSAKAVIHASG